MARWQKMTATMIAVEVAVAAGLEFRWRFCRLAVAVLAAANLALPVGAQDLDPHRIYEERCGSCHASHAGTFVRENIVRQDGQLKTRSGGRDLSAFLNAGHGKLAAPEIAALLAHFESILLAGGVYEEKCRICHDRAVDLARLQLIIKEDRLLGRYTGRDIGKFLQEHGRLDPMEIEKMIAVLRRQLL